MKRDEFVATFPAAVTIVFDYKNSKEMRNTWSRLIVITEPLSFELLVIGGCSFIVNILNSFRKQFK